MYYCYTYSIDMCRSSDYFLRLKVRMHEFYFELLGKEARPYDFKYHGRSKGVKVLEAVRLRLRTGGFYSQLDP